MEQGGCLLILNEREISCRYDKIRKSDACNRISQFAYKRTGSPQVFLVRAKIKPTPVLRI